MKTPYYLYDLKLLEKTLQELVFESNNYLIHYAIKANTDERINNIIASYGLGADCVSGNEIKHALNCGFKPEKIVFAGVGKSDDEIEIGLLNGIACFNVESIQEIQVINSIANRLNKKASIAIRVNPNVDVDTHQYIKTGINENKFGISIEKLIDAVQEIDACSSIELIGLHFHIGSQITNFRNFEFLAKKVNYILNYLYNEGVDIHHVNLGGGLGIDYDNPKINPIPDFHNYFNVFRENLQLLSHQKVHFELGRSIVGQCGDLVTTVLYLKEGVSKKFAIVDAGMTDLIRPALYQAKHLVVKSNINELDKEIYDIVGPICESSDVLRTDYLIEKLNRGDQLKIKSVGAYGQVMVSSYNLRDNPKVFYQNEGVSNDYPLKQTIVMN
jgi:diaminopimelate decarboxylase